VSVRSRLADEKEARRARGEERETQGWQKRAPLTHETATWPESRIVRAMIRRRRREAERMRRILKAPR
jgi:hypothetical protein